MTATNAIVAGLKTWVQFKLFAIVHSYTMHFAKTLSYNRYCILVFFGECIVY